MRAAVARHLKGRAVPRRMASSNDFIAALRARTQDAKEARDAQARERRREAEKLEALSDANQASRDAAYSRWLDSRSWARAKRHVAVLNARVAATWRRQLFTAAFTKSVGSLRAQIMVGVARAGLPPLDSCTR